MGESVDGGGVGGRFRTMLQNYDTEFYKNKKGEEKARRIGREAHIIWSDLKGMGGHFIRRVGPRPFANGGDKILFFDAADSLFGWIHSRNIHVDWGKANDMLSKSEFLRYVGNIADNYDYASAYPHYPSVPGFYYIHKIQPALNGSLETLVDFFYPDSEKDRAQLRAAFMTPFWGKGFGNRPGFLVVAREDDEKNGKGVGKSTVTDAISLLCGGHVDLSKKADDDIVRRALMSAKDIRIARFDNVKGGALSSETLESITTAPNISGHVMYQGHALIPNIYTFYLTFNDAELSQDLSQRFLTVRIRRPQYDPTWLTRLREFIEKNRNAIIADIGAKLLTPSEPIVPMTRFPEWEQEVATKCMSEGLDFISYQIKLTSDREDVDEMTNLRDEFSEVCREKIAHLVKTDPEKSTYAIRASWVNNWLREFYSEKMSRKSARKLLDRILPQGFSRNPSMLDGIEYLIWSGDWHRGDLNFRPTSCHRVVYSSGSTLLPEWHFFIHVYHDNPTSG